MSEYAPLKVLMLTSSYPREPSDTAAVFLRYLAEHIHRQGAIVHVIAPADQHAGVRLEDGVSVSRFAYLPRRWRKLAYGSGILPNLKRNPFLWCQVPFFIATMLVSTLRMVKKVRPDVVYAHWIVPQGLIAVLMKSLYSVPVVVTAHGSDAHSLKKGGIETVKRFCLRNCDVWTSNSRRTAEVLDTVGKLPAPRIIPMGVDVRLFESGDGEKLRSELGPGELIVLFVGRLVKIKGVNDLMQAFTLLPKSLRTKLRLWIVGTGEQEVRLKALSRQFGLVDRVRFLGSIPNNELPDYYAAADLFVGPSIITASGQEEGQGVVFLEAFAARLCVLATRTGGIKDVIDDGRTGVLVDPGNPGQLGAAMARLLMDESRRRQLAENAYHEAAKGYSWKTVSNSFLAVYRSALEGTA